MKKFKVGQIVFISSSEIDKKNYCHNSGDVFKVEKIEIKPIKNDSIFKLSSNETGNPIYISSNTQGWMNKHCQVYNKKNWCSVFLRFMEDHKQQEFKTLTDPLIKYCNDSGNPYTKIVIDIDSAEIVTTERRTINKTFYRD